MISILFIVLISFPLCAQGDKTLRPSPPTEVHGIVDGAKVDIYYSTPSVKGREIWGGLVPYNKVWRTGANEATVFETNKDLTVNGQKLPSGKYGLFTIPGEKEWTFIFNSVWDQWGAFKYDAKKDVLRITTTPEKSPSFHERLIFEVKDNKVVLSWENLQVGFEAHPN
jgi:hypothetical protein